MSDLLPFVVVGLTLGSVYGLSGVGLVLTYKTSGIFNFAHGAFATVAAYAFYSLTVQLGLPWPVGAVIAVFVVGPGLGLLMELLARRLQRESLTMQVAATIGLMIGITAAIRLIYGPTTRRVPTFLNFGSFEFAGVVVQMSDVITLIFSVVVTIALSVYLQVARRGIAMRAVVDNPDLLDTIGTSPTSTRRLAWTIGGAFVAACGVLFSPLLPLEPVQLTNLIIAAFGAAAIGAFTSLPMTFVGGLLLGVLASMWAVWFPDGPLAALPAALPFVVLFLVILAFPKKYLAVRGSFRPRTQSSWSTPAPVQLTGGAVVIALLAVAPLVVGTHLGAWTAALGTFIVFLSLSLLVKTSGQVSLMHVGFMAIGAAGFSRLINDVGLWWPVAILVAGLVAVPVGALLAIPAIRLGGLFLALATFGFGLVLQQFFYGKEFMFGPSFSGAPMPKPDIPFLDTEVGYYYLLLAIAIAAAIGVVALIRGRLGRLLRALADSPTALAASGANANVTRMIVFCLSAFMAAAGGALAGVAQTNVSPVAYPPTLSLTFFVLILIVPGGAPWNSLIAALGMIVLPAYIPAGDIQIWLQLLIAASVIVMAVLPGGGVPPGLRDALDRRLRRPRPASAVPVAVAERGRATEGELAVQDLTVRFGGVVAVDSFSVTAKTGSIAGLIGPNGAGKTTTFNAASGFVRATGGKIALLGRDVTGRGISVRARHGLGRTFQKMELLESQTVRENVAIGSEGTRAGGNPLRHLLSSRRDKALTAARTIEAMELCDIADLAERAVQDLSTGQRRLVELARCAAGDYSILLLDEPSSGLDRVETTRFGEVLRRLVDERGVGVLLVEHDMALVLSVCDRVSVLDFGKHLFTGTPGEAVRSPEVQAAYLGESPDGVDSLGEAEIESEAVSS